jgi:hypothetical protein
MKFIGIIATCLLSCQHEYERKDKFESKVVATDNDESVSARKQLIAKALVGDLFTDLKLDVDATPTTPAWHAQLKQSQKTSAAETVATDTDTKKSSHDTSNAAVKAEGEIEESTDIGPGWKFYIAGAGVLALLGVFAVYAIKHKIWSPL